MNYPPNSYYEVMSAGNCERFKSRGRCLFEWLFRYGLFAKEQLLYGIKNENSKYRQIVGHPNRDVLPHLDTGYPSRDMHGCESISYSYVVQIQVIRRRRVLWPRCIQLGKPIPNHNIYRRRP